MLDLNDARTLLAELLFELASIADELPGVGAIKVYASVEDERPYGDVVAYGMDDDVVFGFSHVFEEGEV